MTSWMLWIALLAVLQAPQGPRKDVKARPIASPTAQVEVRPEAGEDPLRFTITIRPLDFLARPLGPGRALDLGLSASQGRLLGELEDRGDGSYAQVLELERGQDPAAVELQVEVLGASNRVPLKPAEPVAAPELEEGLAEQVAGARADLARRLDLEPDAIELVEAARVTWPDGSLGCPKPDFSYTQALVAGVRVQLRAAGAVYSYHGGRTGALALCESPKDPVPVRSY
jgi:hypothetical protein